jgi:hypothetical protein
MYVIIGSHYVQLEGKFLLIVVVKHLNNVFATGGHLIVEVFESLATSF